MSIQRTMVTCQLSELIVPCLSLRLVMSVLPLVVLCLPGCHLLCLQSVCLYHSLILSCLSVFLQEDKGISCELVELDFLKCSVGFPFMRAQTKVLQLHERKLYKTQSIVLVDFID